MIPTPESTEKKPFQDTNYAGYEPFAEELWRVVSALHKKDAARHKKDKNDKRITNITSHLLYEFPLSIMEVQSAVEALGFRRVNQKSYHGNFALVFEGSNHQMLRIVTKAAQEQSRSKDPSVLQPLVSTHTERFTLELLPKAHTLLDIIYSRTLSAEYHITEKEADALVHDLMAYYMNNERQVLFDPSMRNIAVLRDKNGGNVPVLLDPGALVPIEKLDTRISYASTDTYRESFIRNFKQVPEYSASKPQHMKDAAYSQMFLEELAEEEPKKFDFTGAQEAHLKLLGLEPGQASHVISESDLEHFRTQRLSLVTAAEQRKIEYSPHESLYVEMADRQGLYPSEIQKIMQAAKEDTSPMPREGFCKKIRQARDSYLNTQAQGH